MDNIILVLTVFFNWILKTSFMSSVLVCLILIVRFLLKDNLKVKWQYVLWFILIARLILPWAPESSFSLYNLFSFADKNSQAPVSAIVRSTPSAKSLTMAEQTPLAARHETDLRAEAGSETKELSWGYTVLLAAWGAGVVLFQTYLFSVNRKFSRKMKKRSHAAPDTILSVLDQCKSTLRMNRSIPLVITHAVEGPTLFGCLRPKLLLPAKGLEEFSDNELRYIFLHELVHFKRKDIFVNWLMTVILIFHWFNPVLWYAYKRMREDQELSCDAIAVSYIRSDELKEYGCAIIKLLERYSKTLRIPAVTNFSADRSHLKRRITMIVLFKKNSYKWSILGLVTLFIIAALALSNAKAAPRKENAGEPTKEIVVPKPSKPTSDSYVVINDYYYVPNGDMMNESQLGEQIAQVKRIGDWEFKQTGDTNFFAPPAPIHSIKGMKSDEKVAIKAVTGGTKQNPEYTFLVLERSETVKAPDEKTILGAKNDPNEVAIALKNIRGTVPYVYELQTRQNGVTPTLASYRQDAGVTLYYRVPEADDNEIQGFLFMFEYPKDILEKISGSAFNPKQKSRKPPEPTKTFELNGIHWSYYGDHLLRGEAGGIYYEIQTQGKFTYDSLIKLLKYFDQNKN